jgi:hypothetical protein
MSLHIEKNMGSTVRRVWQAHKDLLLNSKPCHVRVTTVHDSRILVMFHGPCLDTRTQQEDKSTVVWKVPEGFTTYKVTDIRAGMIEVHQRTVMRVTPPNIEAAPMTCSRPITVIGSCLVGKKRLQFKISVHRSTISSYPPNVVKRKSGEIVLRRRSRGVHRECPLST